MVSASVMREYRFYVVSNEDWRLDAYADNANPPHMTVGVGFNLDRSDASAKLSALGLDIAQVRNRQQNLTDAQVDRLFTDDMTATLAQMHTLFPNFDTLDVPRQTVLLDMAFNLGIAGLGKFVNMIAAVNSGDWQTAANEMRNSIWYQQVGLRAARNVASMATGLPPVMGSAPHPKPIDAKTGKEIKESKDSKEVEKPSTEGKGDKDTSDSSKDELDTKQNRDDKDDADTKSDQDEKNQTDQKNNKDGKDQKENADEKQEKDSKDDSDSKDDDDAKDDADSKDQAKDDKDMNELP